MAEKISTYTLDNLEDSVPMDRDEFYAEQKEEFRRNGKPSKAVDILVVFLFTEKKEIILQKRSHTKAFNPGLIDKSIGGHMQYGDSAYYTAMVETVQELQVPSMVLRPEEDLQRTYDMVKESLQNTAIIEFVDRDLHYLDKYFDKERITIAQNVSLFFGIYAGNSKPVDREASGILYYELDVLRDEMKDMPKIFTPDMHFYMEKYREQMDRFLKILD